MTQEDAELVAAMEAEWGPYLNARYGEERQFVVKLAAMLADRTVMTYGIRRNLRLRMLSRKSSAGLDAREARADRIFREDLTITDQQAYRQAMEELGEEPLGQRALLNRIAQGRRARPKFLRRWADDPKVPPPPKRSHATKAQKAIMAKHAAARRTTSDLLIEGL